MAALTFPHAPAGARVATPCRAAVRPARREGGQGGRSTGPARARAAETRPLGGRARRRRGRVTRRGRLVLFLLVIVALLVVAFSLGRASSSATSGSPGTPGSAGAARTATGPTRPAVVVQPGDTLWAIASRAVPDADPRVTIQRIVDLNGLSGPVVVPGQRLVLPTH